MPDTSTPMEPPEEAIGGRAVPLGTDVSPYVAANGGLANMYPSAYERELKTALRARDIEITRLRSTITDLLAHSGDPMTTDATSATAAADAFDDYPRPWALAPLRSKYYGTEVIDAEGNVVPGIKIWIHSDIWGDLSPRERIALEDLSSDHYENMASYTLAMSIVEAVNAQG